MKRVGAVMLVAGLVLLGVGFADRFAESDPPRDADGWTSYAPLSDDKEPGNLMAPLLAEESGDSYLDRLRPEVWLTAGVLLLLTGGIVSAGAARQRRPPRTP